MRKISALLSAMLMAFAIFAGAACQQQDSTANQVEDAAEDAADAVGNAAEEAEDAAEDATQ